MSQSSVKIQLNDIIEINAPSNTNLDKKKFIVIYASESTIKLIEVETFDEINLFINEEGNLMDTSIQNISLLSRDKTPSYALQNNLIPETWIDITFSGDIPTIITGQITNLEEDMIEIKVYPSNSIIYIDFGYKGLPEELSIKEISIRAPPKEILLEVESKLTVEEEGKKLLDSKEEIVSDKDRQESNIEEPIEDPDRDAPLQTFEQPTLDDEEIDFDNMIIEGDAISFGEELGQIIQEVTVDEKRKRYGLDIQTTDLMDDILSTIPTSERNNDILKEIQRQINRYIELREGFSIFDSNGNVDIPKLKGIDHKPLKESLLSLNKNIPWIIPVVKNKKKMYDIDGFDEAANQEMDIAHFKLSDANYTENTYNNDYKTVKSSSFVNENDRYKILISNLDGLYTSFQNSNNLETMIERKQVKDNIHVVLNNQENSEAFVYDNKELKKNRFILQRYNAGLTTIRKDKLKNNYTIELSNNEEACISSFLMLPEKVMKYTKGFLPGINISKKTSINQYPFYHYKLLNNQTLPNTILINQLEKITPEANTKFLSSINEFILDSYDGTDDKYEYFLDKMIPRIKNLFLYSKEFLNNDLSVKSVIKELEPFLVYEDDITYMQYNEISKYIKLQIIEYKKKYVLKGKEFRLIPAPNETLSVNPLVSILHNTIHPLTEKELDNHIFENIYKIITTDPTLDILEKLSIDNHSLISKSIAYANLTLLSIIDIESEFKELNDKFQENLIQEKTSNKCGTFVLAKKYLDYDEMMDDNDKDIYFDKMYDTTIYDIIDSYKKEKSSMSNEEFSIFLIEKLKTNVGLTAEKAIEDAEAMILGRRPVKEGFYAMLNLDGEEEEISFYRRLNNRWEKDEAMAGIYAENSKAFCNVQTNCLEVNDICSSSELAESEIKKNAIKYILEEFDKKLDLNIEELKEKLVLDIQKCEKNVAIFKQQARFNLLKHNNYRFSLGMKSVEVTQEISPHERLRDLILGHNSFSEKQQYILLFVKNYTRESIHGENMYWLYCKDTNIKLLPVFLYKLARSYNTGQYLEVMADICKTQGAKSDDESWWVDRHSGYQIKQVDFSTDEGYDEQGFAIRTSEILQQEKQPLMKIQETKQEINPILETIDNIITAVTRNMKIFIEGYRKLISNTVYALLPKIINEKIYGNLVKIAEKKQKKIASYENSVNKAMIILTLSLIHISIQISIPSVKTRHTFPRCFRSFAGYPLDGDGSLSGIEYISCVTTQMTSSEPPWNSIKKIKPTILTKEIKNYIEKHIIVLPNIIELINEKKLYLTLPENQLIPGELNINNWNTFLPPIETIQLNKVSMVGKVFQEGLKENMKTGNPKQYDDVLTLISKASLLTMEIIKLVQKVVATKTPILTNKLLEPFLENSCCHEGFFNSYQYFANENPTIEENNMHVLNIEYILYDYHNYHRAPLILDYRNTRLPITIFNNYTEEFIYKSIIHYCNLNNDLPIPEELKIFLTEKPEPVKNAKLLSQKIDELKTLGKNFNEESLRQLMSIVFNKNTVEIEIPLPTTNIDRLSDLIETARDDVELDIPGVFLDHLEKVLDSHDVFMYQDTENLANFKDYLYTTIIRLQEETVNFLNTNSSYSRNQKGSAEEFMNTIYIWKPCDENIEYNEKDVYRILEFIQDSCNKIASLFPEMIKHRTTVEDSNIPDHWNLSLSHTTDLKKIIKDHYSKLNKYLGNKVLIDTFGEISRSLNFWMSFLKEIQCISGIYGNNPDSEQFYKYTLFNKNTCILIYRYVYCFIVHKIFNSVNETVFKFIEGKKDLQETTTDVELESEMLKLEEVDFSAISIDKNKTMIANYIIDVSLMLKTTKNKVLNFSLQDIVKNVNIEKEKEKKFEFTDKLASMTDEERSVNTLMKNNKLGDWGKGSEKGLTQYVKETFDKERDERERRIIMERKLQEKEGGTDNINIFAMDYEEDLRLGDEIDHDVYALTNLPEDDDLGDNDDNDWGGGN